MIDPGHRQFVEQDIALQMRMRARQQLQVPEDCIAQVGIGAQMVPRLMRDAAKFVLAVAHEREQEQPIPFRAANEEHDFIGQRAFPPRCVPVGREVREPLIREFIDHGVSLGGLDRAAAIRSPCPIRGPDEDTAGSNQIRGGPV
jgi:hypothetical protein